MKSKKSDWTGRLLVQGQSTLGLPAWLCLTSMRLFIEAVLDEPERAVHGPHLTVAYGPFAEVA